MTRWKAFVCSLMVTLFCLMPLYLLAILALMWFMYEKLLKTVKSGT